MKRTIPFTVYIFLLSMMLVGSSCHKNEVSKPSKPSNQCDTTNTEFNQLYKSLLNFPNLVNDTTMDSRLHSYTFEVTNNKTICKIGYQNLGNLNTQLDLIELYDNTTSNLLYSGSHYFNSLATSYISITPIELTAGNSYTISRKRNYVIYVDELIGRVLRTNNQNPISYPIVFGDFKITGSSFFVSNNNPGTVGVPYIDLVFE